jgi:3-deoxy-manno-octulosonate cytidylyltransferase (CMP-KDO synthetase)
MNSRVVIPARYFSTRLPAKALCDIAGKPMVQHVYEQACKSSALSVVIATEDERIVQVCKSFGAPVCLTSDSHLTGTDRIAETVKRMHYAPDDIIVNVQGDQPFVPHENIDQVAQNLILHEKANIATLCERIHDEEDLHNPAMPKVVMDIDGYALYFSRNIIPWVKTIDLHTQLYYKHMGLYAYRAKTIQQFVTWPPAALELSESLEQLRFLSQGEKIHVGIAVKSAPLEVNTPEDLEKVRQLVTS